MRRPHNEPEIYISRLSQHIQNASQTQDNEQYLQFPQPQTAYSFILKKTLSQNDQIYDVPGADLQLIQGQILRRELDNDEIKVNLERLKM
jgi:hypothetical protein